MKPINIDEIGDAICSILHMVYQAHRKQFLQHAKQERVEVEQLAAAAIAGMLTEKLEAQGVVIQDPTRDN